MCYFLTTLCTQLLSSYRKYSCCHHTDNTAAAIIQTIQLLSSYRQYSCCHHTENTAATIIQTIQYWISLYLILIQHTAWDHHSQYNNGYHCKYFHICVSNFNRFSQILIIIYHAMFVFKPPQVFHSFIWWYTHFF